MDNEQLLNEIKGLLEGMEQRFDAKLGAKLGGLRDELREYVYDTETRIVGGFEKWAFTMQARSASHEALVVPMIERMGLAEKRLLDIEHKLNNLQHPPKP